MEDWCSRYHQHTSLSGAEPLQTLYSASLSAGTAAIVVSFEPGYVPTDSYTLESQQRLLVLTALQKLLQNSRFVDSPIIPNRIARAVLPSLVIVLSSSSAVKEANASDSKNNSKGKKKAKNYAGDEVFKVSRDIICPTDVDAQVLLLALDGMSPALFLLDRRADLP